MTDKIHTCTQCKVEKSLNNFYKDKQKKTGYRPECKCCTNIRCKKYYLNNKSVILKKQAKYNRKYRKTFKPWFVSFDKAKQRCNNPKQKGFKNYGGRGIKFLMTLNDFEELWYRDKAYEMERPSIDRINNDGHYEFENCRFIELKENSRSTSRLRPVIQLLNNKIINNFKSIEEASRETKIHAANIFSVLKQKTKTAGGYTWEYKK